MKKLYTVTVAFEYPVLAESEKEACSFTAEAARDGVSWCARALENSTGQLPDGWDSDSLVYGKHGEDITFGQAVAMVSEKGGAL